MFVRSFCQYPKMILPFPPHLPTPHTAPPFPLAHTRGSCPIGRSWSAIHAETTITFLGSFSEVLHDWFRLLDYYAQWRAARGTGFITTRAMLPTNVFRQSALVFLLPPPPPIPHPFHHPLSFTGFFMASFSQ